MSRKGFVKKPLMIFFQVRIARSVRKELLNCQPSEDILYYIPRWKSEHLEPVKRKDVVK